MPTNPDCGDAPQMDTNATNARGSYPEAFETPARRGSAVGSRSRPGLPRVEAGARPVGGGSLRRVLGLGDEIGTSISSMAPTFTIGVFLGTLAAVVGPSMVIIWAVAILPLLAVAGGFVALNAS